MFDVILSPRLFFSVFIRYTLISDLTDPSVSHLRPKCFNSPITASDTLTFRSSLLWIVHNLKFWSNECMVAWHADHQKFPVKRSKTTVFSSDGSKRPKKSETGLTFINLCVCAHTLLPHWTQRPLLRSSRPPDIIRLLRDVEDAVTSLPKRKFPPLLRQHYLLPRQSRLNTKATGSAWESRIIHSC